MIAYNEFQSGHWILVISKIYKIISLTKVSAAKKCESFTFPGVYMKNATCTNKRK